MLTDRERKVLVSIAGHELAICRRPFLNLARTLDMSEEELIAALKGLKEKGMIKTLKATISHTRAGFKENALIAWRVSSKAIGVIKDAFTVNEFISHCYQRAPHKEFNYNLFTMIHAKKKGLIERFAAEISKDFNIDYVLLFTEAELKKQKLDVGKILWSRP